ncbi:hypothetical protein H8E88_32785, partial [candidate division KSB1 bacterium]|nr:hypothetical protein [candidate division KSB1 bacterium]
YVYSEFKDYFPTWKLNFEEFYNIYPVHPATVYYLESISNLFSKARGMVEFFYNSLHAVDPETHVPYIEENANVLITPDKVFDNFFDKIQENQATHDFVDQVYKNFVKEVPLIFQESEEQESVEIHEEKQVAYALVKILILTEIAPGLKKLTIGKLAELTGKGISQLEQEANINFIRHILNKLMSSFTYIKKEDVDGRYNDIYLISPEKSVLDRFQEEVNKNFGRIVNIEKKAISHLIQRCTNNRLPLQNFYDNQVVDFCPWQETPRKFLITLALPERITTDMLQSWEQKINQGDVEYVIVLGYPVFGSEKTENLWQQVAALSDRFKQSFVYWQPTIISEKNLKLISQYYAEQYTYQNIQNENLDFLGDMQSAICQRISDLKDEAFNILIESFFSPSLLVYENEDLFGEVARIIIDFNQLKQRLTDRILSQLYEEHKKIKPIISEPPLTSINEVINYINENLTGRHFAVSSESMKSLIKNLVEKLHLIKIVGFEIIIEPHPEQSVFVRDLLKTIEDENPGYNHLFDKYRKSVFGCTKPQFVFVLYLLSAAGFIQVYYKNRAIKQNQVTVTVIENADLFTPGEQVSKLFLKEYFKLTPLVGSIKNSELHLKGQEKVWENLVEFKERNEDIVPNKIILLERFSNTLPFSNRTFENYLESLNYLKEVMSYIKRSLPSGKGIESLLNFFESEVVLQGAVISFEKINDIDNANLQHIVFIYEYANHPLIPQVIENRGLSDSFEQLLEKLQSFESGFGGFGLETLFSDFEQFKMSYRELYSEYHEKLYPKNYYEEINSLKNSSEFKILKNLSEIELISVKNDFIRIENIFNSILAVNCFRDLSRELQSKPVCSCQLKTGNLEKKYTRDELVERINSGITEYLTAIKSKENHNKIIEYKVAANQVRDVKSSDQFEYFLNMDLSSFPSITELEKNINPHTISGLNEALSGDIIFVDKNLDDLTEMLYGRKFQPAQLKQIFYGWLDEASLPSGEVYISIKNPVENVQSKPSLELPTFVKSEIEKLFPGETIERAIDKIIAGYLYMLLKEVNVSIPGFKQDSLDEKGIKNIVEQLPREKDLFDCLSQKNILLLFEFLKLENLPIDLIIQLFCSMHRFPQIRKQAIAAVYKKMNTFDEMEVVKKLTDSSEESVFLKNFLTLSALYKTALAIPESYAQFLPFAVEENGFFLLSKELVRINEQQQYLPGDFTHFFDTTIRDRLIRLENTFLVKLPTWEKDRNLISYQVKKIVENEAAKFIIIDGLRADFYNLLIDQLCEKAGLFLVEENFCLSLIPSDTETYYQFLEQEQIPFMKCVEREYNKSKFKEHFLTNNEEPHFYIINFLDEKIHAEKSNIADVFAEFMERLKSFLFPILAQLKKDENFYLSSDHGFVEKTGYSFKDSPRYTHGGDSLYERIIPVGKFKKI